MSLLVEDWVTKAAKLEGDQKVMVILAYASDEYNRDLATAVAVNLNEHLVTPDMTEEKFFASAVMSESVEVIWTFWVQRPEIPKQRICAGSQPLGKLAIVYRIKPQQ